MPEQPDQPTREPWVPTCPAPRGLVVPVRVDPDGESGPTKGQARGPFWRCTTPGYYVPSTVTDDRPEQRILEQSMRLPSCGAVTGWAACRLWRAAYFDGLLSDGRTRVPVPLSIGATSKIRKQADGRLLRERLTEDEVAVISGIRCTRRCRALFDEMRLAPSVRESVVAMDMMAAAKQVSIAQMWEYVALHPAWRAVGQVREALALASERSRSPNEVRTRLVWVLDAGLPTPLVNQPIWDLRGNLLGIADLFDEESGTVGEFDGAEHRKAGRHTRDAGREDLMRRAGLEYFKVTGLDLPHRDRVVSRMHATRERALWLPPGHRRWTLEPPPGWEPEPTLDDLLAQRELDEQVADLWVDPRTGEVKPRSSRR